MSGVFSKNSERNEDVGVSKSGYGGQVETNVNSGRDDSHGRPVNNTFTQVPWGLAGALFVAVIGMIIGEAVGMAAVGVWLFVQQGYASGIDAILAAVRESLPLLSVMYLLSQLYMAAAVYAYVRWRGGSWRQLGFRALNLKKMITTLAICSVGFILVAIAVTIMVEQLLPGIDVTAEQQVPFTAATGSLEIALAFLALVVIAPIVEELVFRGLLLPAAAKVFGVPAAVVLISVLFGLLHPPAIAMVTIGVFGLFLSWAYIRGMSLWPAIILHSAKNLIAFISIIGIGL